MNNNIKLNYMTYGADIEFFGKSERNKPILSTDKNIGILRDIEKDGPLFEIRPKYSSCRMILQERICNMINDKPILDKSAITIGKSKYDKLSNKDKELGCEPDLNVYNEFHPKDHSTRLRTAGFHIHIGKGSLITTIYVSKVKQHINILITDKNVEKVKKLVNDINEHGIITAEIQKLLVELPSYVPNNIRISDIIGSNIKLIDYCNGIETHEKFSDPNIIKFMDLLVANTLITIMRNKNRRYELSRRKLYGQAGSYRIKEYGLEYRVLSNYILTKPELMHLMYGLARVAFKYDLSETELKILHDNEERIKYAINNVDYREAQKIYNEITYPILKNCDLNECCADSRYRNIIHGLQKGKLEITTGYTTYEKAYGNKLLKWMD